MLAQLSRTSFRDSLIQKLAVARCTLGYASDEAMLAQFSRTSFTRNLVQRLAVARCTVGYASVEAMFSQLSRASFKGSLSLAVPLAMPRLKRCYVNSLELRSGARCRSLCLSRASFRESLDQRLAVACCALGYASVEAMFSQLFRDSFRGSLSLAVTLVIPRLKRCSLSSIKPLSEARSRSLYP